jgi:hypothetical protein
VPGPFSQSDLDAFWGRYVGMQQLDVVSVSNPQSAAFESQFAAMLNFVRQNHLYGFADYADSAAANLKYAGTAGRVWWNGPTKS